MNRIQQLRWARGLTVILAGLYAWIGLAGHGLDRILGLTGAVLVVVALLLARTSRPTAAVLLVVGVLPLAVAAWWSVVAPLVGLLALLLGWAAIRGHTTAATTALPDTTTDGATSAAQT
ncbi:hypothetical protein [Promicromonospora soli]